MPNFTRIVTASPMSFNLNDQARPSWFDRAVKCAEMISDISDGETPILLSDIGCGDRKLEGCLTELDVRADYRGYDLVPQSNAVRKLDLSTESPEPGSDVIVLLGVVEYLADISEVLRRLHGVTRWLVVSHVVSDFSDYSAQRLDELGWRQHLSQKNFERLLHETSFTVDKCVRTTNGKTLLWRCKAVAGARP